MIDDCPSDSFPLHVGSGILIVYQNALIFKRWRGIKVTGAAYDLSEKQGKVFFYTRFGWNALLFQTHIEFISNSYQTPILLVYTRYVIGN